MSRFAHYWFSKPLAFGLLLAALTLRALIPSGFMPAAGDAFALKICKVGFPADLLADEHGRHDAPGADHSSPHASSADSCPFGSAPATALIPSLPAAAAVRVPATFVEPLRAAPVFSFQRLRVQQPRAPPSVA